MKVFLSTCTLLALSFSSIAQITPQWLSYPSISPDASTIAFTYKGDIYSVPSTGGEAKRLTFHKAHDYKAVWSSDSKNIAFASDRHGNFDVYMMSALGGAASRLTYHSNDETPYTFDASDSAILFGAHRMDTAKHRQHPGARFPELYSVPSKGGRVEQVMTLPVEHVQLNADGSQLIYQDMKGTENEWRKHHKSAATRDIWRYDTNTGKHSQITSFIGEDRNPVFSDDYRDIYYLSEQNGTFNVHKLSLDNPSEVEQLTNFELHPVRFLSAANKTLAFTHHGELYTMNEGAEPSKLTISIRTQDVDNATELLAVDGEISDMAISPNGKEIAFISRGDVFVSSVDGSFVKQITQTAVREDSVSFSPEGDYLVYASQRNSKWSIFKAEKVREQEPFFYAATLINESVLIDNAKDNYQPKISPDGNNIAYVEDRLSIRVMNLKDNKSVTVIPPELSINSRDGDQQFSWSPDSKWILFQYNKFLHNADVAIVSASGNDEMRVMIPSGFYDTSPKWVDGGKQILWFSNREGLKSYATSGRSQNDVYSLFLNQQDWDKYNLSEDDFALLEAIEEIQKAPEEDANEDKEDKKKEAVADVTIQWKGLDRRIARLTIHSSNLSDAVLNKDANKLYYLSQFEGDYDLWETDLRTKETKKTISLGAENGSLMWDPDMENLYLLSDGNIAKIDLEEGSSEGIKIGEQMLVDHDAVREASFDHVWLRTSKIFYEPTFHGVDWPLMRAEYKPKVSHVATPQEFTHLLSEMLGELNVSHSGARDRSSAKQPDTTASLGIFFDYDFKGDGIKITEVITDGPLDKAQFSVQPGDIITKIDGQTVTNEMDWPALLNRKAGKFVLLDVVSANEKSSSQITIKAISEAEQASLLYSRFIKNNEAEVLARSNGQLGYVHLPSMSDAPYRSIYDDMMGRFFDKKAMVIDARFNNGGDLVSDLAMFFTGERFITYANASKIVGGEPVSRYTKPVISLFNESMYSDGHCYASGYTDLKVGKSVGMPVPGTCSFAGWEMLPMGVGWGVVPWSAKNKAGEWMENNQTSPDVIIKNLPGIIDNGRDQQLERAVDELLGDLE
ncbi:DPP IV N-terminal domain-containing protein [Glaciecola sp. SC05]|uniref:S41 family peptidase n=1 Tax=Glaciecola sp. SC05 TaxID=1987355 RepID=UPI003527F349